MLENCRGKIDERIAHNILKTTLSNFTGDSSAWTNIGWGPSRKNVKGIAYLSTFLKYYLQANTSPEDGEVEAEEQRWQSARRPGED